jgi:hypothetical protein
MFNLIGRLLRRNKKSFMNERGASTVEWVGIAAVTVAVVGSIILALHGGAGAQLADAVSSVMADMAISFDGGGGAGPHVGSPGTGSADSGASAYGSPGAGYPNTGISPYGSSDAGHSDMGVSPYGSPGAGHSDTGVSPYDASGAFGPPTDAFATSIVPSYLVDASAPPWWYVEPGDAVSTIIRKGWQLVPGVIAWREGFDIRFFTDPRSGLPHTAVTGARAGEPVTGNRLLDFIHGIPKGRNYLRNNPDVAKLYSPGAAAKESLKGFNGALTVGLPIIENLYAYSWGEKRDIGITSADFLASTSVDISIGAGMAVLSSMAAAAVVGTLGFPVIVGTVVGITASIILDRLLKTQAGKRVVGSIKDTVKEGYDLMWNGTVGKFFK